jgi:TM2 domain-containing membrane protein YozV
MTEDKILLELRLAAEQKSHVAAYMLWFFFYWLGAHRFYCGRWESGLVMALCIPLAILLLASGDVFGAFLAISFQFAWGLLDIFLIPGLIKSHSLKMRKELESISS